MNLTGRQLYSSATRNLRKVKTFDVGAKNISVEDIDQQFKLTFIYPMLFDKRLQKFEQTMRNFMAVSMLKEIFVSNALNIVASASKSFSLTDENGNSSDVQTLISQSSLGQGGSGSYQSYQMQEPSAIPRMDEYKLQEKIREKTAIIKRYLATEPRVKKLNPFVELITLENLIDVPVIVGTKAYSIDSLTLAYVLTTAIALKKPIGGPQGETNIKYIFNVIKRLDEKEAWNLLANMSKFDAEQDRNTLHDRLISWLAPDHPKIAQGLESFGRRISNRFEKAIGKPYETVKRWRKTWIDPRIPSRLPLSRQDQIASKELYSPGKEGVPTVVPTNMPRDTFKPVKEFDILNVVQGNLKEAELFFKFMLNDNLLRSQFGLTRNPGQIESTVKTLSPKAGELSDLVLHNFLAYLGYNINMYTKSLLMTIHPHESIIDYQKLKEETLDKFLMGEIAKITGEVFSAVENSFRGAGVDENKAKLMKSICTKTLGKAIQKVESRTEDLKNVMLSDPMITKESFGMFTRVSTDIGEEFDSMHQSLAYQLGKIINNPKPIFDKVERVIDQAVENIVITYHQEFRYNPQGVPDNIAILRRNILDHDDPDKLIEAVEEFINQTKGYIKSFIRTLYYVAVMGSVCQYVDYIDIEIETVANDALDLPNYTLVVPLETIVMLHAAVVSKSWRHLLSKGVEEGLNVTDNYVKGIVKFINQRLDVPNLIVIDSKRGQVYYKLQYMTQINKSNIRTFETYVENMTRNELEGRI